MLLKKRQKGREKEENDKQILDDLKEERRC
jgi:hypothetical protein